jgi:hypothetical protein
MSPFRDLPDFQSTGKRDGKASRFVAADDQSAAIRLKPKIAPANFGECRGPNVEKRRNQIRKHGFQHCTMVPAEEALRFQVGWGGR